MYIAGNLGLFKWNDLTLTTERVIIEIGKKLYDCYLGPKRQGMH